MHNCIIAYNNFAQYTYEFSIMKKMFDCSFFLLLLKESNSLHNYSLIRENLLSDNDKSH